MQKLLLFLSVIIFTTCTPNEKITNIETLNANVSTNEFAIVVHECNTTTASQGVASK